MAFDLDQLSKPFFSVEFESVGTVQFFYTPSNAQRKLLTFSEEEDPEPADIIRMLICEIGCKSENSDIKECPKGQEISWEESRMISEDELDIFSRIFIEHRYIRKRNEGIIIGKENIEIEKKPDEKHYVFLSRAIILKAKEQEEHLKKLNKPFEDLLRAVKRPSLELQHRVEEANRLSAVFDEKYDHLQGSRIQSFPEVPHIDPEQIRAPVHDTNEKLEVLIEQIKEQNEVSLSLLKYIKEMNDGMLTLSSEINKHAQESFDKSDESLKISNKLMVISDKTLKRSTWMLRIAIATMIITLSVLIYDMFGPIRNKSILQDIQQSNKEIVQEIRELNTAIPPIVINDTQTSTGSNSNE